MSVELGCKGAKTFRLGESAIGKLKGADTHLGVKVTHRL